MTDPATGQEITRAPGGDAADADRAVAAARRAFDAGSWRLTTAAERGGLLLRLAGLIEEHAGELAVTEAVDSGKPLAVVRSRDMVLAVEALRRVAGWATMAGTASRAPLDPEPGTMAYRVLAPAGVVGVVVPWAFPLLMALWQLAPAIAAGPPLCASQLSRRRCQRSGLASCARRLGSPTAS